MRSLSLALVLVPLLSLVGCALTDPYERVAEAYEVAREDSVRGQRLFADVIGTLEERAARDDLSVRHLLGMLYAPAYPKHVPPGLPVDSLRGIALLMENVETEHAPSTYRLGFLYYLQGDFETSANYLRRAAELGWPPAQEMVGRLYAWGQGVERNPERAVYWLRRAMENDDERVRSGAAQSLRANVHSGLIPEALATEALDVAREIG